MRTTADAIDDLTQALSPTGGIAEDASGGHVTSLAEAVMGVTAGLFAVAEAVSQGLNRLADEHKEMGEHQVHMVRAMNEFTRADGGVDRVASALDDVAKAIEAAG